MPGNGASFHGVSAAHHLNPGDLGRRIALRREQLGLTREQVADRAGMSPSYVQYLEEQVSDVSTVSLMRLARALDTTPAELRGGRTDLPTGTAGAAHRPELREMDLDECREHLSTHGVGRVSVVTPSGPAIVPVNYSIVGDAIVYRTAPGTLAAVPAGSEVAFEVDHIDDAFSQGWSVLVVGHAEHVTDPGAVDRLSERVVSRPWAGGDRDLWVCIEPLRITGRRISID